MNDPDNFGFGDISPNTLEAEHQQEQGQEQNTSTQQILLQPLLRRREEGTQYRRNFVSCTRSDNNRRMDNHRERHAVV